MIKKTNKNHQKGFSLFEILIALSLMSILMITSLNWFGTIKQRQLTQTQYYQVEQALFYQLEAYPEKLTLKELYLDDLLIENWIDRFEMNSTTVLTHCQKVTVSVYLKKPFSALQSRSVFQQERLFCESFD